MAPKIDPGGLSEPAGAARSTQEQQTATKKSPRATQERPKSAKKRFSRFSQPPGESKKQLRKSHSKLQDGGKRWGEAPETPFSCGRCCEILVFPGSSKKWLPLS